MSTPEKLVVDCSTGETYSVPLTAEEIADREQATAEEATRVQQEIADRAAKAAAKQSAQEKLKALGLTDVEILAITGI